MNAQTPTQEPSILMVHARSSWGGNTATVLALARGLVTRGYRVELAAHYDQPYIEPFRKTGITVHEIGIGGKLDLLAPCRLAGLIRSRSIDIVHSHTRPADLAACIAAKMTARPLVITQHGNVNLDRKTLKRRHDLFSFGYNTVLRGATRIAAVCQATKQELVAYSAVPADRIMVIYNGMLENGRLEVKPGAEVRKALGIAQYSVVGLITGAIHWKGHEVLAQAVAKLKPEFPDFIILAAGVGPREAELQAQISHLGIGDCFRLLGFRADVPDLLAASDLFILPSRSEAFPISILEAMAAGLPVVASRIGGIPEQVDDGVSGLLVTPGSVDELTDALSRVMGDKMLRRQMGGKGREKAGKFSLERMVEGYVSLYNEVMGGGNA